MVIKLAKYIFPFFIIFGNHNLFCSEISSPTKNIEFNINHAEVISGFPIEGNLIIAKTKPENKVLFNNQKIQIDDSGIFIFGFHRDEESSSKLVIINSENDQFETIFQPIKREYKIQRINGLKQSMVSPPKELIKKIPLKQKFKKHSSQKIFGPPGTGKTTFLLSQIKEHVDKGVKPENIAFISFTNAAANEAKKRFPVCEVYDCY